MIIKTTQNELDSMGITKEMLQEMILERVDSTVKNDQKLFWQVEISAEVKLVK